MPNLSTKELTAIEESLSGEMLLVKKFTQMANSCSDQQLKEKLTQIASKHQQHFDLLFSNLS